jgi:ABC-type Na+ efflux pump permease subunit
MENKNIIIILVAIIVILSAAIGFALFNPTVAKEPTKIKITSDKEQFEGGELSIKLTDLNKTPISKQIVNITVTNKKGKVVVDDVVKTNSKGKAKLDLDLKKGKYKVTVAYGGNENYTGANTTQKLTIKEEVVEANIDYSSQSQSSSGNSYSVNNLPPSNDPYPETSREQVDENTVMQKYEDGYISYVDLRTGERTSGGFYK